MRRFTIIQHASLDGVIQSFGGLDEDRAGGYTLGGWAVPHADPAISEAIDAAQGEHFDLLLGRHTYDIFMRYWPNLKGPMADKLNRATKYVATHRPESLTWGPAESLGADVLEAVRKIRSEDGPDLITWGSSELIPLLFQARVVDEILLLIFPVLLGKGKRLLPANAAACELTLVKTKASRSGVLINTYRLAGALRTGSFA